jgi:excisionase family DNA binding protein
MTETIVSPDLKAQPALLDVHAVAALLNCSARHVYRLSDGGRMPPPIKLGALVRWRRQAVEDWIAAGCEPVRQAGRAGR